MSIKPRTMPGPPCRRKAIAPSHRRPVLARRMGLDWKYAHPRDVFAEMRSCMDSIAGITWERLEHESSVT